MTKEKKLIAVAMAQLEEEQVFKLVRKGLAKGMERSYLVEAARDGVQLVIGKYQRGEYFLADLIMSAEIFKNIIEHLLKYYPPSKVSGPPVVFGTVENDIHDIGKNIVVGMLRCRGLDVIDLGVDVPAPDFISALEKTGSKILCLSGLITPAYESMRRTVVALEKEGMRNEVSVVIGGLVNEAIKEYVSADYYSRDASQSIPLCLEILKLSGDETVPDNNKLNNAE